MKSLWRFRSRISAWALIVMALVGASSRMWGDDPPPPPPCTNGCAEFNCYKTASQCWTLDTNSASEPIWAPGTAGTWQDGNETREATRVLMCNKDCAGKTNSTATSCGNDYVPAQTKVYPLGYCGEENSGGGS